MTVHFKPGVLPKDPTRPRLFAEDYYTEAAAVHLTYSDYSQAQFPMYGNDMIGDCTIAGLGHLFGAWTKYAGTEPGYVQPGTLYPGTQVVFTDQAIVRAYSAVSGYNPVTGANDNGATLQDVLSYAHKTGLPDPSGLRAHKVDAYAEIRNLTPAGLSVALSRFGGVYVAVSLPQSAEDQFNAGDPWTPVPGSPILGGHCITLQRVHTGLDDLTFATWGSLVNANMAWVHQYVTEAWAVYSADFINASTGESPSGLNATQLVADMQSV